MTALVWLLGGMGLAIIMLVAGVVLPLLAVALFVLLTPRARPALQPGAQHS